MTIRYECTGCRCRFLSDYLYCPECNIYTGGMVADDDGDDDEEEYSEELTLCRW